MQISLRMHQAAILQEAPGASTPGLLKRIVNVQICSLLQVQTNLKYMLEHLLHPGLPAPEQAPAYIRFEEGDHVTDPPDRVNQHAQPVACTIFAEHGGFLKDSADGFTCSIKISVCQA